jgi:hypothetical protein
MFKPVKIIIGSAAGCITAALLSAPVMSQELTGTLKKIKETGTITVGFRESSIARKFLSQIGDGIFRRGKNRKEGSIIIRT